MSSRNEWEERYNKFNEELGLLYLENETEAAYYCEFFFYTFLRVHTEDVL